MIKFFHLDENKNVIECSRKEWAKESKNEYPCNFKRVGNYIIGKYRISTVFFGCDFDNYTNENPPSVFQSMIFKDNECIEFYTERYSGWKQAEEGHERLIQYVKDELLNEIL